MSPPSAGSERVRPAAMLGPSATSSWIDQARNPWSTSKLSVMCSYETRGPSIRLSAGVGYGKPVSSWVQPSKVS
jgi:hypothetical protein